MWTLLVLVSYLFVVTSLIKFMSIAPQTLHIKLRSTLLSLKSF